MPPRSFIVISETGYITQWMQHFINFVKPNQDKKVLLLLDGHSTHTYNLDTIKLARDNGVLMLQLPGHTTHLLQIGYLTN